jgi:hypothetical protein
MKEGKCRQKAKGMESGRVERVEDKRLQAPVAGRILRAARP